MNCVAEDMDTNDDTPEVARQQGDVEESRAAHTKDQGCKAVENAQAEGVSNNPADDVAVPSRLLEAVTVEDGGLHTVNAHAEETHEG